MKVFNVGTPLERLALDFLCAFPECEEGNKFVLCIGNNFTRWVLAVTIPKPRIYDRNWSSSWLWITDFRSSSPVIYLIWGKKLMRSMEKMTDGIRHQDTLEWPKWPLISGHEPCMATLEIEDYRWVVYCLLRWQRRMLWCLPGNRCLPMVIK